VNDDIRKRGRMWIITFIGGKESVVSYYLLKVNE